MSNHSELISNQGQQRRIKRGWMNLKVERIVEETWDTKTFFFTDADEGGRPFDFIPAQYLTFRFDHINEKPLVRSYSMSSSPCETDYCAVTVKAVPSGIVSNWLLEKVQVGDILRARGPIGKFAIDPYSMKEPLYMVAGGCGVTPFVSILREYSAAYKKTNQIRRAALLVAYRSKNDLICWETIKTFASIPGISLTCSLTREHAEAEGFLFGRPDEGMLKQFFNNDFNKATFMTCGPDSMMDSVVEFLKKYQVNDDHIMRESFFTDHKGS